MPVMRAACGAVVEGLEERRLLAASPYQWAITFGTKDEYDIGYATQTDAQGNVYVAGVFQGQFDVDPSSHGKHILQSDGNHDDIFLIKYSPKGKLVWAHRFGSGDDDSAKLLQLAPNGDILMAGGFQSDANFGTDVAPYVLHSHGQVDGYVARFDSADGRVKWAGSIGGEESDAMTAIAAGPDNDVYIAGTIRLKGDIDPTAKGTRTIVCRGVDDSFLERLDGSTGKMKWNKVWGENDTREQVVAMAVDARGSVYATGMYYNTVHFDRSSNKFTRTPVDDDDVYLAKVSGSGKWSWVRSIGGENEDTVAGMVMGDNGDLYLTGNFSKTANFATTGKAKYMTAISDADAYVARYHPSGKLVWARQLGGEDGVIVARAVSVDHAGNVYTSGEFINQIDFDPGAGSRILDPDKSSDAPAIPGEPDVTEGYISKLDANGKYKYVRTIGGRDGSVAAYALAATATGEVYVTGTYANLVDFKPGAGAVFRHTKDDTDDTDFFLLKLSQ